MKSAGLACGLLLLHLEVAANRVDDFVVVGDQRDETPLVEGGAGVLNVKADLVTHIESRRGRNHHPGVLIVESDHLEALGTRSRYASR
jgi:hypothetical protein